MEVITILQKRIARLEAAVSKLPPRRKKTKPYIADDWTITELFELVNTCPDYPPDLAEKHSLTNWDHSATDGLTDEELSESIISTVKRLNELGDFIDLDRIVSML